MSIKQDFDEFWDDIHGKLSIVKTTPMKIIITAMVIIFLMNFLSYFLPIFISSIIVASFIIILFRMFDEKQP